MESTANSTTEDSQWQIYAERQQKDIAEMIGDAMDICPYDILKTRVGIALFGIPEIDENICVYLSYELFKTEEKKIIENIAQCIFRNQIYQDKNNIYVGFILLFGRPLNGSSNFQECVFRVPSISKGKCKFIDRSCRVYQDWESFIEKNTYQKAIICYPENGIYKKDGCRVVIKFCKTPSAGIKHDILFGTDIATSVIGIVSSVVLTTSLLVPIAAPVIWTAFSIAAATGVYEMGRSIEKLVDRSQHDQTLSMEDPVARAAWLGATLPIFGIAADGATTFISTASRVGLSMNLATRTALNVTNGLNCTAQAVALGSNVYGAVKRGIDEKKVSVEDIFQCIASALLFSNAVISTHQARLLLQVMPRNGLLPNISKPTKLENGFNTRMTNTNCTTQIIQVMGMFKMGAKFLKISPKLRDELERTMQTIVGLICNERDPSKIVESLLPQVQNLWKAVKEQIDNLVIDLLSFREFPKKNNIHIPLFMNQGKLDIMYFSYLTLNLNFQQLISNIVESNSFSLSENEQYCEVAFKDSGLKYTAGYIIKCETKRGLVLLKHR